MTPTTRSKNVISAPIGYPAISLAPNGMLLSMCDHPFEALTKALGVHLAQTLFRKEPFPLEPISQEHPWVRTSDSRGVFL
jgi:hypothetical protein